MLAYSIIAGNIQNQSNHWSLRMSRHIAPVTELMFGCHIFVKNRTFGGLNGYVSGIFISSLKFPPDWRHSKQLGEENTRYSSYIFWMNETAIPSYGVPGGPAISPISNENWSFSREILMHGSDF